MTKKYGYVEPKSADVDLTQKREAKRKRLLARVAGHVAAGLLVSPSPKVSSSEKVATVAVDIAEAILAKIGL